MSCGVYGMWDNLAVTERIGLDSHCAILEYRQSNLPSRPTHCILFDRLQATRTHDERKYVSSLNLVFSIPKCFDIYRVIHDLWTLLQEVIS